MDELTLLASNVAIAFVGGLVGAAGGAWGAQRIVEKTSIRKELLSELRSVNALIQLGASVCNTAIGFRSQFSRSLHENLVQKQNDIEYVENLHLIGGDQIYLQFDFQRFPSPEAPIEIIQEILHSKISNSGRTIAAASEMYAALRGLGKVVQERDFMIQRFVSGEIPKDKAHYVYLGLRQEDVLVTDVTYPKLVESIDSFAQDLAFFSHILCVDLVAHGHKVRNALINILRKKSHSSIPRVSTIDFSRPLNAGFLPPDKNYAKWLAGFHLTDSSESTASSLIERLRSRVWRGQKKGKLAE